MRTKHLNYQLRGSLKNPFHAGMEVGTRYLETAQFEAAIVVDVITNDTHPEYAPDGYNVGVIKFRFLDSQDLRPDESLNLAFPADANLTRYPVLHELVTVFPSLNRFYYTVPFNVSNRPTSQAIVGMKDQTDPLPSSGHTAQAYDANAQGGAPTKHQPAGDERLGQHFIDKPDVFRLRPHEGDVLLEGRSGHSVRFGSNFGRHQAPNLLLRVGPNPAPEKSVDVSPFALVNEDINLDLSSIWVVSDQVIPLTFATVHDATHFTSVSPKPGTLDGNQIVINSDRIVLNTKRDKLLVSTFLGTHFTTLQDHTVDAAKSYRSFAGVNREVEAKQDIVITAGREYVLKVGGDQTMQVAGKAEQITDHTHAIVGSKVFIGSRSDESEPQVLGEQLRQVLLEFVDAHLNNAASHVLPTVGIGPLSPGTVSALQAVRAKLVSAKGAPFESTDNFVTKTNSSK